MRAYHASTLLASLLLACATPDARQVTLPVAAHTLPGCAAPPTSNIDLTAFGDFPSDNHAVELRLNGQGALLNFPLDTQGLSAIASDQSFRGYTTRHSNALDFLLWPEASGCELFRPNGGTYPGGLAGQAIGYAANSGLVLVAGGAQNDISAAGALTFDVRSGATDVPNASARAGLIEARAFATVSEYGDKLLVAGGQNLTLPSGPVSSTAEVYDPATASFGASLLSLRGPRNHHAAVTLSTGEVALIGGESSAHSLVSLNEVVTPATGVSRYVVGLNPPRSYPVAFRLADHSVFVAGGIDGNDQALGAAEWLSPDAVQDELLSSPPPTRFDRAYVEIAGSSVLAVGGCEDRPARFDGECDACAHGCPPLDPNDASHELYDAYVIARDGTVVALPTPPVSPHPILLPGSDGRPWLIASGSDANGNALPGTFALFRFNAWSTKFEAATQTLTLPANASFPRVTSVGPDAFVWLADETDGSTSLPVPVLRGVRFGTRAEFANDVGLVQFRDPEHPEYPAHLAPDHPPQTCPTGSGCADSLSYDGTLQFGPASSPSAPVCVFVADATFADFGLQLHFQGATPNLSLGSQILGTAASCAFATGAADPESLASLEVERTGDSAVITSGGVSMTCTVSPDRLTVALCANSIGPVSVQDLSIVRSGQ
ncbi:MAG TPA: kelch repeat-containing protein [Polyangiaceae bacterium]|jgi:hypothetical protein